MMFSFLCSTFLVQRALCLERFAKFPPLRTIARLRARSASVRLRRPRGPCRRSRKRWRHIDGGCAQPRRWLWSSWRKTASKMTWTVNPKERITHILYMKQWNKRKSQWLRCSSCLELSLSSPTTRVSQLCSMGERLKFSRSSKCDRARNGVW